MCHVRFLARTYKINLTKNINNIYIYISKYIYYENIFYDSYIPEILIFFIRLKLIMFDFFKAITILFMGRSEYYKRTVMQFFLEKGLIVMHRIAQL